MFSFSSVFICFVRTEVRDSLEKFNESYRFVFLAKNIHRHMEYFPVSWGLQSSYKISVNKGKFHLEVCNTVCNVALGLPWQLGGKKSSCSAGDAGWIPRSGRSSEEKMATHSTNPRKSCGQRSLAGYRP